MAFNFIPNQPVIFDPLINTKNYLGNMVNRPKISTTDKIGFAVGSTPSGVVERVKNYSFDSGTWWTTNGSWTISGGAAEYSGGAGQLTQPNVLSGILIYEIVISGLNSGEIIFSDGFTNWLTITEDGTYTGSKLFFGVYNLVISGNTLNTGAKIESVSLKPLINQTQAGIFWENGTLIDDISSSKLLLQIGGDYIPTFKGDFTTDPTSGDYGCLKFGVNDDFSNQILTQSDFSSQGTWTTANVSGTSSGSFVNSSFKIDFTTNGAIQKLVKSGVLEIGREYTVLIQFLDSDVLLNTYNFSESGDPILAPGGIISKTFTADQTDLEIHFEGNIGDVSLGWIELYQTPYNNNNWTFSNIFEYGDCNDNTILLEWSNNVPIFGLPFGANFFLSLRVGAKLFQPDYENERDITDDLNGKRFKRYFKRNKIETLVIEPQTQPVHDSISIIPGCATFKIDGVNYEWDDESYSPDWEDTDDNFAPAQIKVSRVPVSLTAVRNFSGDNISFNTNFVS